MFATVDGPALPLQETWAVGLGDLLRDHPEFPGMPGIAVGYLNKLGSLAISSKSISFDGTEVPWNKIEEIEFGSASELLISRALEHEIERLTDQLPPMPGRAWLVRQAVDVLIALCSSADVPDGNTRLRSAGMVGETSVGVPVKIAFRAGRLRGSRKLTPGMFVTLVAALVPNTSAAISAIARERGVKITASPPLRYREQAVAIRQVAGAVAERLRRGNQPHSIEVVAASEPEALDIEVADEGGIAAEVVAPRTQGGHPLAEMAGPPALERGSDDEP
ncbi:hypothetical protein [Micromonospora sp. 4G55]|uniref:hypothetical protein n=1 Tax=Micromonospora sp. 4G55 TaxID=2806102 RepID=UPI001A5EC360|nr:hypothetical protein [Micromonospora sp. 4G55]MBM0255995.1 hypothetical protein [Micromonospora sp. 4G55]